LFQSNEENFGRTPKIDQSFAKFLKIGFNMSFPLRLLQTQMQTFFAIKAKLL
jgi:hypothetical protein